MGYKKVRECIKPRAGDADLWFKIWEELHELVTRGILVEVAHVIRVDDDRALDVGAPRGGTGT